MFGGLILVLLFFVLIIVVIILIISIIISKNKLRTTFKINIGILIFVLLFFFIWFPVKENTVLKLKNGYLVEIEDFEHTAYYLTNVGYLEGLKKEKNNWIGYINKIEELPSYIFYLAGYDELTEKERNEIDKKSGYFIINSKEEIFNLTEEQLKEKLKIKNLNLKYPFKVIRQYGEKKELSPYYKFIEDNYLSNKINITTLNTIKYTTIALLILVAVILKIKLIKKRKDIDK